MRARWLRHALAATLGAATLGAAMLGLTAAPAAFAAARAGDTPGSGNGVPPRFTYTVTIKQWIPFDQIVDPFMPLPVDYDASTGFVREHADPNCLPNTGGRLTGTSVKSGYHGDGHKDFDGTFRMLISVKFIYQGVIFGFDTTQKSVGETVRIKTYNKAGKVVDTCTAKATAKFGGTASAMGANKFEISVGADNPLALWAPTTMTSLTGEVQTNGDLKLSITAKNFPSQGVQVTENGTTVLTDIVNDVSCLPKALVEGLQGAVALSAGLGTDHTETITTSMSSPKSLKVRSELCR